MFNNNFICVLVGNQNVLTSIYEVGIELLKNMGLSYLPISNTVETSLF